MNEARQLSLVDDDPRKDLYPEELKNERYTPAAVFLSRHRQHRFTIDAAATDQSAKLPRYWTVRDNGLAQAWSNERVFINPPWDDIDSWLRKALDEASIRIARPPVTLADFLLPAWTDRSWWSELVEPYRDGRHRRQRVPFTIDTTFLPGRVAFGCPDDPEARHAESPPFWCVWLLIRPWQKKTGQPQASWAE